MIPMPSVRSDTERTLRFLDLNAVLKVAAASSRVDWITEALTRVDPLGTVYGLYRLDVDGEDTVCLVGEVIRPAVGVRPRRRALWYVWSVEGEPRGAVKETEKWPADERRVGDWAG